MILVFDLDGTLCDTHGMAYMDAEPKPEVIERVNALADEGHRIIIDTSRGYGAGIDWTERTARQLDEWGVKYHKLRCGVKMPADRYVDTKAIQPTDI